MNQLNSINKTDIILFQAELLEALSEELSLHTEIFGEDGPNLHHFINGNFIQIFASSQNHPEVLDIDPMDHEQLEQNTEMSLKEAKFRPHTSLTLEIVSPEHIMMHCLYSVEDTVDCRYHQIILRILKKVAARMGYKSIIAYDEVESDDATLLLREGFRPLSFAKDEEGEKQKQAIYDFNLNIKDYSHNEIFLYPLNDEEYEKIFQSKLKDISLEQCQDFQRAIETLHKMADILESNCPCLTESFCERCAEEATAKIEDLNQVFSRIGITLGNITDHDPANVPVKFKMILHQLRNVYINMAKQHLLS